MEAIRRVVVVRLSLANWSDSPSSVNDPAVFWCVFGNPSTCVTEKRDVSFLVSVFGPSENALEQNRVTRRRVRAIEPSEWPDIRFAESIFIRLQTLCSRYHMRHRLLVIALGL